MDADGSAHAGVGQLTFLFLTILSTQLSGCVGCCCKSRNRRDSCHHIAVVKFFIEKFQTSIMQVVQDCHDSGTFHVQNMMANPDLVLIFKHW